MKYDQEFKYIISGYKVNIGIMDGSNVIVLIIPGQNSGIYGYENRYLKLSKKLNKEYGATVIISSNPFQMDDPISDLMHVINKYAERFDDYKLYYFGFSKGANIGAQYATMENKFSRLALINGPLMINYHKTKDGLQKFKGEKISFVFGSLDPSYQYVELIAYEPKENKELVILENMNHNVEDEDVFLSLADDTLFYDFTPKTASGVYK